MTLTIDLLPHLDAGDRTKWRGDQNERPLTDLGRRQAAAMADAFQDVEGPDGPVPFVATPLDCDATPVGPQGLAPELGQQTEGVLQELGCDWDQIIPLKEKGAIP